MTDPFPHLVSSRAVVLRLENIDTDVITPIARVLQGRQSAVRYAFEPLRFGSDGERLPSDPFNDQRRVGAQVLIAGRNFGCGSSRETAAWAIRGLGFRVVIASSFGDIFYSNCLKNGILAIRLEAGQVETLMDLGQELAEIEIDLPAQCVRSGSQAHDFQIGLLQKEILLSGLDEIGLMQTRGSAQALFDARDALARPWVRNRTRMPG